MNKQPPICFETLRKFKNFVEDVKKQERERIKMLITKEIALANIEGTSSARLTSLFNRI